MSCSLMFVLVAFNPMIHLLRYLLTLSCFRSDIQVRRSRGNFSFKAVWPSTKLRTNSLSTFQCHLSLLNRARIQCEL
ncbi:hypothetical protein FPV67DRAFT_1493917, partial [Lyophyllum atratum]